MCPVGEFPCKLVIIPIIGIMIHAGICITLFIYYVLNASADLSSLMGNTYIYI